MEHLLVVSGVVFALAELSMILSLKSRDHLRFDRLE